MGNILTADETCNNSQSITSCRFIYIYIVLPPQNNISHIELNVHCNSTLKPKQAAYFKKKKKTLSAQVEKCTLVKFVNRRRIGSLKAAINMYEEKILDSKPAILKKSPRSFPENSDSRTRELHLARRDISRYNENKRVSELVKSQAESELYNAKKTVEDLTSVLGDSSLKVKAQMRGLEKLKKQGSRDEEWALAVGKMGNYQYAEVMRELEFIKQELSKLKLDMAFVLEEKSRAEKETEASTSKLRSYSSSAEAIRKEIEEATEEQVLVELARIEAQREFVAVGTQRENEANEFSSQMEQTKKKIKDIIQEIDLSKELETKLADAMSDVDLLQNELKQVREMDNGVYQSSDSLKPIGSSFQQGEELENPRLLESISEELESAKKELASIKEEGFQFMTSMDIVRYELRHVMEETSRLQKTEHKAEVTIQNLNSKLLRAKSRLEAASGAEEKATGIVSNLRSTLEKLKTEAEAAKKEKELISEETISIKAEIQKTESEIDLSEERLQAAMQELETVKSSEAIALEKLKTLTHNTMRARASASQHTSSITISNFEYEYLTGRAVGAEELADKKVAAAQAWIEALKAGEKEILMRSELAHREVRELRLEEKKEVHRTEKSLSAKKVVEGELRNWRRKSEKNSSEADNMKIAVALPRKTMKDNGNSTPARRAKFRKSASPAIRYMPRSTSITLRKRKKAMPNLSKFFSSNKSVEKSY